MGEGVSHIQQQIQPNHYSHGDVANMGNNNGCSVDYQNDILQSKRKKKSSSILLGNNVLPLNSTRGNNSTCDDSLNGLVSPSSSSFHSPSSLSPAFSLSSSLLPS